MRWAQAIPLAQGSPTGYILQNVIVEYTARAYHRINAYIYIYFFVFVGITLLNICIYIHIRMNIRIYIIYIYICMYIAKDTMKRI